MGMALLGDVHEVWVAGEYVCPIIKVVHNGPDKFSSFICTMNSRYCMCKQYCMKTLTCSLLRAKIEKTVVDS